MKKVAFILLGIALIVLINALFVTWLWSVIVPSIFEGAIKQGLIPAQITPIQAFGLVFLFSVLTGNGIRYNKKD